MQSLSNLRTIPEDSPVYFEVHVPDKGGHVFRIPRPSVVGRLLTPLITSGLWKVSSSEDGTIDGIKAELVEEAVGAAIGTCWRHRSLELDTKRRDFDRGEDGLLEYGAEVLGELYESGYSQDDVATLLNDVVTRLMIAIPSSPQEVQEIVDFTAPRTDSKTTSTST